MMDETLDNTGTDAEAVAAVRRGDAERYRELVERHERRVFAVAWSRLGDTTLAEEATQEAFIRGYRRLWLLGDGAKFSGWITSVARNVAINLGLRHRRELNKRERWALEHPGPASDHSAEAEVDPLHSPEALRQALAELPTAHRECLVLFYLEGKSGTEAAAALGISEAALRVRLHRARAVLRERLEEKLESSLEKLRPSKSLVPAIMAGVLASTTAKAATAGGTVGLGVGTKLLGSVGKFLPFYALFPLLQIIGSLPGMLVAFWISRVERRNFRDGEGFRAKLHRNYYRTFLWGFPLMMVLILLPSHLSQATWGLKGMYLWTVSFLLVLTLISARSLTINRNPFQIGMFIYCCVLCGGILALALGWLPPTLSSLPMVLGSVVLIFVFKYRRPARMDYNLFLRTTQGLIKPPIAEAPRAAESLDRPALLTFARFLGSRWLAANHRWEANGLALRLPWVETNFLRNMGSVFTPVSRGCSRLLLRWNGTVLAHCGDTDAAALASMKPSQNTDPTELEFRVASALEQAWSEVRQGNHPAAELILGEQPEADVFFITPARSAGTRRIRLLLGVSVLLMVVVMFMNWWTDRTRMVSGRHLKPIACSEADVRATLALWDKDGAAGSNALREANMTLWLAQVLPPNTFLSSNLQQTLRAKTIGEHFSLQDAAAQRVDHLLGYRDLMQATISGWISLADLGLTREELRDELAIAPVFYRQSWFASQASPVNDANNVSAKYTVLFIEDIAKRVLCLKHFDCLDVVSGDEVVELLLKHQVLSGPSPPGRRTLPYPELLHGTFLTMGYDPIQDTYQALVVLEGFGALNRINREACIRGILRFHHGQGLFGSVKEGDGFVIFGDSRDTFWAFESLRILGGLDQAKDLPQWKFRPQFTSKPPPQPVVLRNNLTWAEIESWVLQQRLAQIIRELQKKPEGHVRSLLEP